MGSFNSPVKIGETVYDVNANAYKVYSVQFYEKNVALKCTGANGKKKTFLVGKKSVGRTIFVGPDAFEEAVAAMSFTKGTNGNSSDLKSLIE